MMSAMKKIRYRQMLVDFKLDPASTAKFHVPDLPF